MATATFTEALGNFHSSSLPHPEDLSKLLQVEHQTQMYWGFNFCKLWFNSCTTAAECKHLCYFCNTRTHTHTHTLLVNIYLSIL